MKYKNLTKKRDLAREVAKESNMTIELADEITDSVFKAIRNLILRGHEVRIHGFGTFYIYSSEPITKFLRGEAQIIPPHKRIKFKASPVLTNAVNLGLRENFELAGFEFDEDE